MREVYANETSGEPGSAFGGTLVELSQLSITLVVPSQLSMLIYSWYH